MIKKYLYQLVYNNDDNIIHDKKQCKTDLPRYNGYIEQNDVLMQFKIGQYHYDYFYQLMERNYKKNIIDILNFCPQQIFVVILEEILKRFKNVYIAKTTHQIIIKKNSVQRILEGLLLKDEKVIKKFRARLKLKFNDNFVTLNINYYL